MFNQKEYLKIRPYLEMIKEFSLMEIIKETAIKYSTAVTYLSKYLSEISQLKK